MAPNIYINEKEIIFTSPTLGPPPNTHTNQTASSATARLRNAWPIIRGHSQGSGPEQTPTQQLLSRSHLIRHISYHTVNCKFQIPVDVSLCFFVLTVREISTVDNMIIKLNNSKFFGLIIFTNKKQNSPFSFVFPSPPTQKICSLRTRRVRWGRKLDILLT